MTEQDYDLIERYFLNALSEEGREEVERRLDTDSVFSEAFDLHKSLMAAVDEIVETDMKAQLKDVEASMTQSIPNVRSWVGWTYALAAVVLMLVIGYWVISTDGGSEADSSRALYAANFEPYRNLIVPIERGEADLTPIQQAFQAYENQDYEEAVSKMNQIFVKDNSQIELLLYQGVAHLALNQPAQAIQQLSQYPEEGDFYGEVNWYLALACLSENNPESAQVYLKKVINAKGDAILRSKAQQLWKELKAL